MRIDTWIDGYKVVAFPWIDGKHIYVNVQYWAPGSSLSQPPAVDKTAYITDDENGRDMVQNFLSSLVSYIARLEIEDGNKVYITMRRPPWAL